MTLDGPSHHWRRHAGAAQLKVGGNRRAKAADVLARVRNDRGRDSPRRVTTTMPAFQDRAAQGQVEHSNVVGPPAEVHLLVAAGTAQAPLPAMMPATSMTAMPLPSQPYCWAIWAWIAGRANSMLCWSTGSGVAYFTFETVARVPPKAETASKPAARPRGPDQSRFRQGSAVRPAQGSRDCKVNDRNGATPLSLVRGGPIGDGVNVGQGG